MRSWALEKCLTCVNDSKVSVLYLFSILTRKVQNKVEEERRKKMKTHEDVKLTFESGKYWG
jgi:hypothetical protein